MNTLRNTCAAVILSLALAVSAVAGQIDSPGAKPPTETTTNSTGIVTIINALVEKVINIIT